MLKVVPKRPRTAFQASTISCASVASRAIGFSHITCLPACRAAMVASLWAKGGVQTLTMSSSGSFSISS